MKKNLFESLRLEIIKWEEEDIVTASESSSEGADDIGGWHDNWFGGGN